MNTYQSTSTPTKSTSALDSLMVLAQVSSVNSNSIEESDQISFSRSSTPPSIVSDDNANLKGATILIKPRVLPMTIDHTYGENNTTDYSEHDQESIASSEPEEHTSRFTSPSTHSFLSNEILSTKFKRPKNRGVKKDLSCTEKPSSSEVNEESIIKVQIEDHMKTEMIVPWASTKKTKDKIKSKQAVQDQSNTREYGETPNDVKVSLQEINKIDKSRTLFPKQNDANRALFPMKLFELLNREDTDPKIISWAESGKSFHIHNVDHFTDAFLPRVFNQTSFASFQRQLNLYGFKRVTKTSQPVERAYFHEMFARDSPELCLQIRRNKARSAASSGLVSDSDSVSANEPSQSQTSAIKQEVIKPERKPRKKRKIAPKIQSAQDSESDTEFYESPKPKIPKIINPFPTDSMAETSNNVESVDGYTRWLALLSQDALHKANSRSLTGINDRVSALNHLLAPSLPIPYSVPTAASLFQLQQKRQLLANLGIGMQLPNTGNLLNPLNQATLNASNLNFVKQLLNANNGNNQGRYNQF